MPPFQIDLYPSKLFLRITVALYVLTALAVWLTAFSFVVSFGITVFLALSLFWSVKKIKQTSSTLKYANSEWKLTQYGSYNNKEIREFDVQPNGEMLIHRWLIVVDLIESDSTYVGKNNNRWLLYLYRNKQQKIHHTLLVFPDSTDEESHRRMRVALQYAK